MISEETSDFPHDDDTLLDRLADGELSGFEYRQLLASLDHRPDGWKRCALALLEAQALRGELRSLAAEQPPHDKPPHKADSFQIKGGGGSKVHWVTLTLSVAASFLLALGIGMWLRGAFSPSPSPTLHVAKQPSQAPRPEEGSAVPDTDELADQPPDTRARETENAVLPRGSMTLVVDGGEGESEEVELPVYDVSAVDPAWFEGATVSQADAEALEASGFQLLQQRGFVPFDLDGRCVLVPMEQVEIVPVSAVLQ
jgi:hypothetical protein